MPAGFHVVLLNPVTSFVEVFTLTLPAFNPVSVKVLVPTLTSLFLILAVPTVTLPFAPRFTVSARRISNWFEPFATTPILPVVNVPAAPPFTFSVSPSLRDT